MIHKKALFGILLGLTLLFNVSVILGGVLPLASVVIAFPYLVLVPGFLVLLILRADLADFWRSCFYAVALSLVLLMAVGLGVNWLLPLFHNMAPLSMVPLLIAVD